MDENPCIKTMPGFLRFYRCAGGKIQKDGWSCPFYGLTFAIALHESEINYASYKSPTSDTVIDVPWGRLPPQFIWNAQSWQFLTMYLDVYSDYSGAESSVLTHRFGLSQHSFFSYVTRSLVADKEGNIKNKGIRKDGEEMVLECLQFLRGLSEEPVKKSIQLLTYTD